MNKFKSTNVEDVLALTPLQEGMLFHYLKEPDSHIYCEQLSLGITGEIDAAVFKKAWDFVICSNEMLRTVFRWEKVDNPIQVVLKEHKPHLDFYDLSNKNENPEKTGAAEISDTDRRKSMLQRLIIMDTNRAFDLREVPFRLILCKIDEHKYQMVISNHHILYDGWSTGIILREFTDAYTRFYNKQTPERPVKTKFKEFVRGKWNRRLAGNEEAFWKNFLDDCHGPVELSVKKVVNLKSTDFKSLRRVAGDELHTKFRQQTLNRKVSPAALLYTAWGILLQKYVNKRDVLFGTTVSGRDVPIKGIENMVGLFINTVPLPIKTTGEESVASLLKKVAQLLKEREEFNDTPLTTIKKSSGIEDGKELFDTVVVIENYPLERNLKDVGGLFSFDSYSALEQPHYDLTLTITLTDDTRFQFLYWEGQLEEETIIRLSHHYINIISNLLEYPSQCVKAISMLSGEEQEQLLYHFNTPGNYSPDRQPLHLQRMLESQVEKTPFRTAIIEIEPIPVPGLTPKIGLSPKTGTGENFFTYGELSRRAGQLARRLSREGVKPGVIVGFSIERSFEMILGIWGILNAGGAYLPISPDYPAERIKYILEDSGTPVFLCRRSLTENPVLPDQCHVLYLENTRAMGDTLIEETAGLPTQSTPCDPAYVIYTSGSTGQPKGVVVEHASTMNLLHCLSKKFPFGSSDSYLLKTPFVFDVSMTELFHWIPGGGRLVILEREGEKESRILPDTIWKYNVTHINFIPSMFNVFLEALTPGDVFQLTGLKYIFLAGEALLPGIVNKYMHSGITASLENLYGPTETTVYASLFSLRDWDGIGPVPIGRPLDNMSLYILDHFQCMQAIGVPGELGITGIGLARGYLNRPGLTKEIFLSTRDTGLPINHSRIYLTGDLARWLPDGNIQFLGRIDQQVKIRGIRIELGEIENRLLKQEGIEEAVVLVKGDHKSMSTGEDSGYLCAYVVSGKRLDPTLLKNSLALELPGYMIPAHILQVQRFPLTGTGKVDRKALPDPAFVSVKAYQPPVKEIEMRMTELWAAILNIAPGKIGIDDNFFQLGGHSLKAMRLMGQLHKAFDTRISLPQLFKTPTIRELSIYIDGQQIQHYAPIEPVEKKEYYPLSPTQERFFIFQKSNPTNTSYNMPEVILMEGYPDKKKIEASLKELMLRHENLRTSFFMHDGQPVQRVHDSVAFEIAAYDPGFDTGELIRRFSRPFDLENAPLLRVEMFSPKENINLLMVDIHHIIADGVSVGIFIKEFLAIYNGEKLPPLRVQYKDFVNWIILQRSKGADQDSQMAEQQMEAQLITHPEVLNLPLDYVRSAVCSYQGEVIPFGSGGIHKESLLALALKENITLYMLLLGAFYVLLSKLSGQEQVTVGSPISGRVHSDLEGIIGLLINTLVLTASPSSEKSFSTLLAEIKNDTQRAFENQQYQYELLVKAGNIARDAGRNPLFDVMFVLQNMHIQELEIHGLKIKREFGENHTSKFDMTLYCEQRESLVFKMEYNIGLFKKETILRFIDYFLNILSCILANPHQKIAAVDMMGQEEKQRVLYQFNNTGYDYNRAKTIYRVFEEQVARTPDNIAVKATGAVGDSIPLTYSRLNREANRLARLLRNRGTGNDNVIGIMLDRSPDIVVGILAILKAGAAYLPIDPEYPESRITAMLESSNASFLLSDTRIAGKNSPTILLTSQLSGELAEWSSENLEPGSGPGDLIYIIFTSGSTGNPKGAGVCHRGFMNLMHWFVTEFELDSRDSNLLLTSLGFDLTQKNLYAPLIKGGTLCIPRVDYFEPRALLQDIRDHKVTWINCTPSMFSKIVEYEEHCRSKKLETLRYVFLGGEPITMAPLINWLESENSHAAIVNTYGPTECTDICASFLIRNPRRFLEDTIPIGKPIYNVRLYVSRQPFQPLPVGVPGELMIAGEGVGTGYVNDESLTSKKFVRQIVGDEINDCLLYRTGDLVKWLPDGNIVFLGRIDHQVKVRGFRIEPGEIESRLRSFPDVKDAVVTAREDSSGDRYLCSYIIPCHPKGFRELECRQYLAAELPGYMVPTYFVLLDKFPLNPNGKINLKELPAPDLDSDAGYTPPTDEWEREMTTIWAEILGISKERISVLANFFYLGGHSLKAIQLIGKIHKKFMVEIPVPVLFKHPTIKSLSAYISHINIIDYSSIIPVEKKEYYPLSAAQKRIYTLSQMSSVSTLYNIPSATLLKGNLDLEKLKNTFHRLILRHESLRTLFRVLGSEAVQVVRDEVDFKLEYCELEVGMYKDKETIWGEIQNLQHQPESFNKIIENFVRAFNLEEAPLLRSIIIKLDTNLYLFLVDMHHIISDATSIAIFIAELATLYSGKTLPPVPLQYKDYSQWQNNDERSEVIAKQEDYWLRIYSPEIPDQNLPFDYKRSLKEPARGTIYHFEIEKEKNQRLNELAAEEQVTLYMVILSILSILLGKLCSRDDIIVGTVAAGRNRDELQSIMGMFVNTLALRISPGSKKNYKTFLAEVKKQTLDAFENQDYPFDDLVNRLGIKRDPRRNPLFDVIFALENFDIAQVRIEDMTISPFPIRHTAPKFDMTWIAGEREGALGISVHYRDDLFKEETIELFKSYFEDIVSALLEDREIKIRDISLTHKLLIPQTAIPDFQLDF